MNKKIKVIEVEATKLDPNAHYLIVLNKQELPHDEMHYIAQELMRNGVRAIVTASNDPQNTIKVYQIPRTEDKE